SLRDYKWDAREVKCGVKNYYTTDVVYAAMKLNYPECTRSTFERTSKDWLKNALARLKTKRCSCVVLV
ncbi:unnamed protein product, partial [Allacma fusca]